MRVRIAMLVAAIALDAVMDHPPGDELEEGSALTSRVNQTFSLYGRQYSPANLRSARLRFLRGSS